MITPEISISLAAICESLKEIAESLDYLAARSDGEIDPQSRNRLAYQPDDDELEPLTEQELWRMYEHLKAGYVKDNPAASPREYERAMRLYCDILGI